MDALSLSFRWSSVPELNNFLPRRPTLERKLTSPAVLETSETRLRSHSHQFEKCIGLQLPDIVMTKQPRIPKSARIGDITRSCKDDELVKLDIVASKKRLCEGANLSNGAIRKTKLSVDFQSRYKVTDGVSTALPLASSSSYQQKSKATQQFIGNSEKNYDSHKEKAILLQNWIISQRTD